MAFVSLGIACMLGWECSLLGLVVVLRLLLRLLLGLSWHSVTHRSGSWRRSQSMQTQIVQAGIFFVESTVRKASLVGLVGSSGYSAFEAD